MRKILVSTIICGLMITSCDNKNSSSETATESAAGDATTSAPVAPPDSATAMKNWMEYGTPGDMHQMMASWNGTWTGEMSMWNTADAPVEKATVTSVNRMLMDGRYQESKTSGNMMGMPFEGLSTMAYDNAKKEFINTWIDNMGTGMVVMHGNWDAPSKSIILKGKMLDPSAGTVDEKDYRQVITDIDKNTQKFEMYSTGHDGKEFKMMEILSTRK